MQQCAWFNQYVWKHQCTGGLIRKWTMNTNHEPHFATAGLISPKPSGTLPLTFWWEMWGRFCGNMTMGLVTALPARSNFLSSDVGPE
jgi:hypothetical protein